ncbi:MAG: anaerobic ribonucleoside-triphosphate reductase activating protein [Prevotella sp.]|nr:anaerobic ribonucleoside-triphosphate reductase activating protein [Prevotella sp.]
MLSVLDIIEDTMVDGPGFRTSIYCAGCHHACPGCQNPQSWDINNGHLMSTREIMDIIKSDPWANVTFSGGDPMYQAEGFTELARAIRQETDKDIWCFTGYTYEQILHNPTRLALLEQLDVLVDGPFIQTLRNPDLLFRGSSNQRLINVQASLKNQRIVLLNEENLLF